MIKFSIKCPDDHIFESWFKSSAAFDALAQANMVTCPVCGAAAHEKALMAPDVRPARNVATAKLPAPAPDPTETPTLSAHSPEIEKALKAMRKHVQDNSDYVGDDFAKEARAIHLGDAPERAIYGEASKDDAKKLIDDGVPVAPLPFMPDRKVN